jgi:sulfoxide reductase heme-binding subunit YedZ
MAATASLSPFIDLESKHATSSKSAWSIIGVHLIGFLPLVRLTFLWLIGRLTANPIQFLEQQMGFASMDILVLVLMVTPLITLTGWKSFSRFRRLLGLYAFFYFTLHFFLFSVLDYGSDWREISRLVIEKPFLIVGVLAGLILFILAITSSKQWMKRLGKSWKLLHNAVYLAAGLVILHYALAVKGSLSNLSGDMLRPLEMGLFLAILLILRIPPVRCWVASLCSRCIARASHFVPGNNLYR